MRLCCKVFSVRHSDFWRYPRIGCKCLILEDGSPYKKDELFRRFLEGRCGYEEVQWLLRYFNDAAPEELGQLIRQSLEADAADDVSLSTERQRVLDGVQTRLSEAIHVRPRSSIYQRLLPYAAAVLVALAVGLWFLDRKEQVDVSIQGELSADIPPGGNRATLTLADGQTLNLSETQHGIVIGQEGLTYDDGTPVDATAHGEESKRADLSFTLTTPKGGTYQLTLSDGTKVWLNAASTLKYPVQFDAGERTVELEGEAFFKVSEQWSASRGRTPRTRIPFFVKTGGQTVEVVGTQFNISAYDDEIETRTTLVEGKVNVSAAGAARAATALHPGEQATTKGTSIQVKAVDTDYYTAWTKGLFYFKRTPLADVLRQVSRWYDVEVIYGSAVPTDTFSGKVTRNVSLMELLDILQVSAIAVKLEGNKLVVD